uniref:USP domain-containing protein n=1 Tax=Ascaris lumbricoides TaxID=6252 RepID=A0A0M3IHR6_ASCLU
LIRYVRLWSDRNIFSPIPKVDDLCINLYRDADPKKKKDRSTLIGYVQIKIDQLTARHPVERCCGHRRFHIGGQYAAGLASSTLDANADSQFSAYSTQSSETHTRISVLHAV